MIYPAAAAQPHFPSPASRVFRLLRPPICGPAECYGESLPLTAIRSDVARDGSVRARKRQIGSWRLIVPDTCPS
jgi:hypothetical protein